MIKRLLGHTLGGRHDMVPHRGYHLLPQHHAQQADQSDQWRGRGADMEEAIRNTDGEVLIFAEN